MGIMVTYAQQVETMLIVWIFHSVNIAESQQRLKSVTIEGPSQFLTNGTKTLHLTCKAKDDSSAPLYDYLWTNVHGIKCTEGNEARTCSFTPETPDHDGKVVTCTVADLLDLSGPNIVYLNASFTINLLYPPPKPPEISIVNQSDYLASGDMLTCTASGGKPLVWNVTFSCSSPEHLDAIASANSTSVSSTLTIDTSTAIGVDTKCECSAHWEPEPRVYSMVVKQRFQLEYQTSIVSFSVNGTQEITAEEGSQIVFDCTADGRPAPNVTLLKRQKTGAQVVHTVYGDQRLFYTQSAACEDEGTYVCSAVNGFPSTQDITTVKLTVNCENNSRVHDNGGDGWFTVRSPVLWLTTGGGAGFVVLLSVTLIVCCKRYRRRRTNYQEPPPLAPRPDLYLEILPPPPQSHTSKRQPASGAAVIPGIYNLEKEEENFYEEIPDADSPEQTPKQTAT